MLATIYQYNVINYWLLSNTDKHILMLLSTGNNNDTALNAYRNHIMHEHYRPMQLKITTTRTGESKVCNY